MTVRRVVWLAALSLLPGVHAAAESAAPVLVMFADGDAASLLGVWDTQRWLSPPQAVPRVKADTSYRVQGLTGPSVDAVGGSPVSYDEPCADFFSVNLAPKRMAKQTSVATRADLKARPRSITALPTSGSAYLSVIKAELQKRGLSTPHPKLQQVIRTDLDGDGKDEVILEASSFKGSGAARPVPSPNAAAGDYSLLLLRSVVSGKVKTTMLGEDAVLKASNDIGAPRLNLRFSLEGVADLNGDGTMEIITSESYYEGFTLSAWTWTPAQGPRKVLETRCGV